MIFFNVLVGRFYSIGQYFGGKTVVSVVESAACVFLNHNWLSHTLNLQLVIIVLEAAGNFDRGIRVEMGEYVLNQII